LDNNRREQLDLEETIEAGASVFLYTMVWDTGFAPHVSHGWMSLGCCAGPVRERANPGTIVIGVSGKGMKGVERWYVPIFIMKVDERITFDAYFNDSRFQGRADNIYKKEEEKYSQDRSKVEDKRYIHEHMDADDPTKSEYVLLSRNFIYFGDLWKRDDALRPRFRHLCERITFTYTAGGNYKKESTVKSIVRETLSFLVSKYPGGKLGSPNEEPARKEC